MIVVSLIAVIGLFINGVVTIIDVMNPYLSAFMINFVNILVVIFSYTYLTSHYKHQDKLKYEVNNQGIKQVSGMGFRRWYLFFLTRYTLSPFISDLNDLGYYSGTLIIAVVSIYLLLPIFKESWIGFKKVGVKNSIFMVLVMYVSYIIINGLYNNIAESLIPSLAEDSLNQQGVVDLLTSGSMRFLLEATVLAALYEEIIYRGFMFRTLFPKSKLLAYIVVFVVFGGVHIIPDLMVGNILEAFVFIVPYGLMGVAMAGLYEQSNSIYLPMAFHLLNNSIAVMAILL